MNLDSLLHLSDIIIFLAGSICIIYFYGYCVYCEISNKTVIDHYFKNTMKDCS